MNRYVDVEWLEENAKSYSLGYYESDEYAVPISRLEEAPSIEIVRCKDCKHVDFSGCVNNKCFCMENVCYMVADDFCNHGERSE